MSFSLNNLPASVESLDHAPIKRGDLNEAAQLISELGNFGTALSYLYKLRENQTDVGKVIAQNWARKLNRALEINAYSQQRSVLNPQFSESIGKLLERGVMPQHISGYELTDFNCPRELSLLLSYPWLSHYAHFVLVNESEPGKHAFCIVEDEGKLCIPIIRDRTKITDVDTMLLYCYLKDNGKLEIVTPSQTVEIDYYWFLFYLDICSRDRSGRLNVCQYGTKGKNIFQSLEEFLSENLYTAGVWKGLGINGADFIVSYFSPKAGKFVDNYKIENGRVTLGDMATTNRDIRVNVKNIINDEGEIISPQDFEFSRLASLFKGFDFEFHGNSIFGVYKNSNLGTDFSGLLESIGVIGVGASTKARDVLNDGVSFNSALEDPLTYMNDIIYKVNIS